MKKLLLCLLLLTITLINAQNDECSGATLLTVGTDFTSGAITSTNVGATTDGNPPACNSDAVDNTWFKVVVPASGNLKIETQELTGSSFDDSVLTVYSGACGTLTEIACDDDSGQDFFSLVTLTGQAPGTTLYINVWKYDSDTDSGEFQISAYQFQPPTNDNCSQAIPLTAGTTFDAAVSTFSNEGTTIDGTPPSCQVDAADNVWFTVVVPPSGNISIETREASNSSFTDSVLTVYSGTCGSLTEIECDDDDGEGSFSLINLTGQTPGATLYISVWKYESDTDNGEFQIAAYDAALSTHEVSNSTQKIQVSPNPFTDVLNISDVSKVESASITDALGRVVKTIEKPSSSLQLGELKTGVYFVTLKMNDGTVKTIKTVKK
ncbi:T9SS type A sorting domain-containing protein [Chryseobacterium pennipullorum]|uniref:Uncharacterized protein n=1 Tax=Chryseobacterium pennipullorum TaxID=2258963 RepID=A0A3D9B6W7_9FLAO|nr:T9SS type A sorting domain-containing protein [Chryseobacterium pennipullorum]REC48902.1 hypothetical protein DRF67_04920 [Chryseobacterium pennipullorum]